MISKFQRESKQDVQLIYQLQWRAEHIMNYLSYERSCTLIKQGHNKVGKDEKIYYLK